MTTQTSKACCERPVAISEGYDPKGAYQTLANTKCYIAGPKDARKAVYVIYDVFGFTHQTLQGADILAAGGKEPYLVLVPDLFDGKPVQAEWFVDREDPENKQKIGEFMAKLQDPTPHVKRVSVTLDAAKKEFTDVESWSTIGYCWGGKISSLTSGSDSPWKVAVSTSPARVDPNDAKKCTIPFATLASKDEDSDVVKTFHEALSTPNTMHVFDDQVHGWMSARADLKDDRVKAEYERGYQIALDFLAEHL